MSEQRQFVSYEYHLRRMNEAFRGIGRMLTEHMNRVRAERDHARRYCRQQHHLRANVMRQCAGMRRRQSR